MPRFPAFVGVDRPSGAWYNKSAFAIVKNAFYTVNGLEMYARSSNEQVATVENNVITARAPGTAEITYYFIEQGILKTTATTVTVK